MRSYDLYAVGIQLLMLAYISQCFDLTTVAEAFDKETETLSETHDAEDVYTTETFAYQVNEVTFPSNGEAYNKHSPPLQVILHLLKDHDKNDQRLTIDTTTDKCQAMLTFQQSGKLTGIKKPVKIAFIWPWGYMPIADLSTMSERPTTAATTLETTTERLEATNHNRNGFIWWFKRARFE